jgi:hypothetical protein
LYLEGMDEKKDQKKILKEIKDALKAFGLDDI